MRIASANLLHGVDVRRLGPDRAAPGPADVDLEATARWLAALDADVVALQEVDCRLARSGGVDQVAWLADRLGCRGAFVPALAGDPGASWEEVPAGGLPQGAGGYGVGLLSRVGLHDVTRTRLPHGGAGTRRPGIGSTLPGPDGEPRVVASATTDDGTRISTTHLSYMPWRAVAQLRGAVEAAGSDGPAVLIGDLNLPLWGGRLALRTHRAAGWRALPASATYPSWRPRVQLDQVLVRGLPGPARARAGPAGPSDHLPLVVDVEGGRDGARRARMVR